MDGRWLPPPRTIRYMVWRLSRGRMEIDTISIYSLSFVLKRLKKCSTRNMFNTFNTRADPRSATYFGHKLWKDQEWTFEKRKKKKEEIKSRPTCNLTITEFCLPSKHKIACSEKEVFFVWRLSHIASYYNRVNLYVKYISSSYKTFQLYRWSKRHQKGNKTN